MEYKKTLLIDSRLKLCWHCQYEQACLGFSPSYGDKRMPIDPAVRSRRALLKNSVTLVSLGAVASLFPAIPGNADALAQTTTGPKRTESKGSTVILLGTQGGPGIGLTRGETASALVVDGHIYLIDCGYGTLRALTQAGLSYNDLSDVFLTHLHNDHTADVAALLSHMWTGSRTKPAAVYGPFGTTALVEGSIVFSKADTEIRIVDEGRTVRPESLFLGHDLNISGIADVLADERVKVKAVENTHYPERAKKKMPHRSLAYRFDMADRSVVFSGDTAYCKGLVELAQNADVFVCEVLDAAVHQQMERAAKEAGNKESIARHVIETHSTTEDVGRMASEAKVKTVVLNHLVGAPASDDRLESFESGLIASVHKFFDGKVIVGRDQMRL
jgi:ribonuclease BN (tRNA processing enzyme)